MLPCLLFVSSLILHSSSTRARRYCESVLEQLENFKATFSSKTDFSASNPTHLQGNLWFQVCCELHFKPDSLYRRHRQNGILILREQHTLLLANHGSVGYLCGIHFFSFSSAIPYCLQIFWVCVLARRMCKLCVLARRRAASETIFTGKQTSGITNCPAKSSAPKRLARPSFCNSYMGTWRIETEIKHSPFCKAYTAEKNSPICETEIHE